MRVCGEDCRAVVMQTRQRKMQERQRKMQERDERYRTRRPTLPGRVAKYGAETQDRICWVALIRVCAREVVRPTEVITEER